MKKLLIILFLLICSPAWAETFYVRTDGGTQSQCTGKADAAYPGSGTGQSCALKTPMWAFGADNQAGIVQGGDTVIIKSGSYAMGYDASNPGAAWWDYCNGQNSTYGCQMKPIPSGPSSSLPTKIYGEGWDTGCSSPPELWGTQRSGVVISLANSSNVEIKCLEITDHATCGYYGSLRDGVFESPECVRDSYPHGLYATTGIYGSASSNVLLQDLNIHGLAERGILAGGLTDWTLRRVRIYSNGFTGIDTDIGHSGESNNSGTITLDHVTVQYNGCTESYPGKVAGLCTGQGDGGQGDGFGGYLTGGDWVIVDSNFSFNTQDGLDLLYHNSGSLVIKRSWFEGNAGNQAKNGGGDLTIENSMFIGNCDYYYTGNPGSALRATGAVFPNCRAVGDTFEIGSFVGSTVSISNSTFTGRGNSLLLFEGSSCDGSEVFKSFNNIFVGNYIYAESGNPRDVDWIYNGGSDGNGAGDCGPGGSHPYPQDTTNVGHSLFFNLNENYEYCPTGDGTNICSSPGLVNSPLNGYVPNGGTYLADGSVAIDAADETITISSNYDVNNFDRGLSWDIGGLEKGSTPPAPSCMSDCSLCDDSPTCLASNATCYWWLNGSCQTTEDPCVTSALNCTNQTDCEAAEWYWWSTDMCQATEEELPGDCDTDCALCLTQSTCEASAQTCYYQFDGSCKYTADPCNVLCSNCSVDTCSQSTIGCFLWGDNICRSRVESCGAYDGQYICENGLAGCYWDQTTCTASSLHTRGVIKIQGGVTFK